MEWIIFIFIALVLAVLAILVFKGKSNAQHWLLFAVTEAEKQFGKETGPLKLQTVYDSFCTKFPIIRNFIPYAIFVKMVDKALGEMKELANKNGAVQDYVSATKEEG